MICPHCKVEHDTNKFCWPCSWSFERKTAFAARLRELNVNESFIPAIATDIERLSVTSPYHVGEPELYRYLEESRLIVASLAGIDDRRTKALAWTKPILDPFRAVFTDLTPKRLPLALVLFFTTGIPMLVATFPIRFVFVVLRWRVSRQFHPSFIGWIKANCKKKC